MEQTDNTIQKAIDAINNVLNIHENHLYISDTHYLTQAKERLLALKQAGFI